MLKRVFIWLSIFILLFANIPISFAIEKENLNDNSTETENTVIQQQIEENIDEEKEILSNENIENEKNTGTIEGKSENELIDESQSEINNVKMEATKQEKSISTKIEEKSTIISNGIYQIASAINDRMVLNVENANISSGTNINLYDNQNARNQKFKITYLENGYYKIEAMHSGKVLDVSGGKTSNGTNVQQWESNNTDAQKWIIKDVGNGYYSIISKCNGLYLDVQSGIAKNGSNIQTYEGNGTAAQKFKLKEISISNLGKTIENGIYQIVSSLDNNKVIKVNGAYDNNGANIQLSENYNNINQKFKITYLENGYYKIEAMHSEKVLDVSGGNISNGTNVQQWESNNTDAQKWIIKDVGDGCYNVISKCNSLYMDIASGKIENGTNIQMYEGNGTSAQKFKFVETKISKEIYNGIDVSAYNGEINWSRVSKTQDFAIIRVGYRGYLRPRIVMDTKFLQNIQGAQAQKMECGIYFFSQAINEEEAIEEANWVADMISGYKISYPVVLDSEWSNSSHNGRADTITKEERTKAAKAFLDTIKSRGYIPMLYASPDWIKNYLDISKLSSYNLWLAHYTWSIDKPSNYSGPYSIWQYTSKGSIDGILTDVDRNVCYKQY